MSRFVELGEGDNLDIELSEIQAVVFPVEGEEVTIEPKTEEQVVLPTSDKKLIGKATVKAVTSEIDENIKPENIVLGKTILGVQGNVAPDKPDQTKTTIPTKERQVVRADVGFELAENIVEPIPDEYIITNDADATSTDILKNKTAYVGGQKIIGEFEPLDVSDTTATIEDVAKGKEFYTAEGVKATGTGTISSGIDRLQWKCDNMKTLSSEFYGYSGEGLGEMLVGLDTSQVTNMDSMFNNCTNLTEIPLLDTSKVTDMEYMFSNCKKLSTLPLLNTSNVTSMRNMFVGCKQLTEIPLLNTNKVTIMANMLSGCEKLTEVPLFDTGNVTDMSYMLQQCYALTRVPSFNTQNVTTMYAMFASCNQLTEIPLLNTSKVTNMGNMFTACEKLTTIHGLDMISTTSASNMFRNCQNLTNLTLKNIKTTIQIGSTTDWGHLLTDESLINTAKELWDLTGSTSKTLTMATSSNARFDAIYVKLITATDEMIAQDQYINNKKPCEVCESTDEGAMTLREYVVSKNWALA